MTVRVTRWVMRISGCRCDDGQMKTFLITSGSLVASLAIVLFLDCPMIVCSSPGGYVNWVRYNVESAGEVMFGSGLNR